jgi:hypothetical protein
MSFLTTLKHQVAKEVSLLNADEDKPKEEAPVEKPTESK